MMQTNNKDNVANESPSGEIAALNDEIAQAVTSSLEFGQLLDLVTTRLAGLLGAETVLLFRPEGDGMLVLCSIDSPDTPAVRVPLAQKGVGAVALKDESVLIAEAGVEPSFGEEFPELHSWAVRSLICVPLQVREEMPGVLAAINKHDGSVFGEDDLQLLTLASSCMAVALEYVRLAADLKRVTEEKTEFVSLVSHELKVPMTSIKGYAKLLDLGTTGEMSDTQRQFLDTITRNVNRMDRLVSVLLDLSRLEAGRVEPDIQVVSVKTIVEEAVQKSKTRIQARELALEVDIPSDLPLIYADPTRMVQVLDDLFSNASLYTPQGGSVTVRVRFPASELLLEAEEQEKYIEIEVIDTGVGIAEEDKPKIFNQFFRGDHLLVQKAAGTGFSLMVDKKLVALHNGRIGFTSQLGQGSSFSFLIPVALAGGELERENTQ